MFVQFNKSNRVAIHAAFVVSNDLKFVNPNVVIRPNADAIVLLEGRNSDITTKPTGFWQIGT